jgi:hypothetical protein
MLRLLNGLVALVELVHGQFGIVGLAVLFTVVIAAGWALYQYGGQLFFGLLYRNFRAHGKVLRDAQVQIHSIQPAPEPAPDEEDLEFEKDLEEAGCPAEPELHHYYLEATITPQQDPKTLDHPEDGWHPSSLMLIEAGRDNVELMEVDGAGFIQDGWVIRGQKLTPYLKEVCHGPERLKLHISVQPDCRRLRFLYMQEMFGDIVIPAISAQPAARA